MFSLRSTYLTCALLALFAVPGFSTPIFFADSTTWQSAVTGASTVTFDPVGSYNTPSGFTTGLPLPNAPTFQGMLQLLDSSNPPCSPFSPGNCSLQIIDHNLSTYFDYGHLDSLWWGAYSNSNVASSYLHVTFPTPVTAVAVNLATYGGSGVSYTARLNNDPAQTFVSSLTTGWPNSVFFGFTSPIPVSSIDFYLPPSSNAAPLLNSFSYGNASGGAGPADPSEIPEVATFLAIASGLLGMAGVCRRGRKAEAGSRKTEAGRQKPEAGS